MNPSDDFYRGLAKEISKMVKESDNAALADLLDDFNASIIHTKPSPETAQDILGTLKGGKQFHELCRTADMLVDVGVDQPSIRLLYSQGMIELGQLNQAQQQLEGLRRDLRTSDKRERSEAVGLLGRLHKQRFVRLQEDRQLAAKELSASIECYNEVFNEDPAWHGANLVALLYRAEQDGIVHAFSIRSDDMAEDVLKVLRAIPENLKDHWTDAALGEVSLALEDWRGASESYGRFVNHKETDSFALGSAARNLKEIWDVSIDNGSPASSILMALDAKTLTLGRGSTGDVNVTTADMGRTVTALQGAIAHQDETLQAILGRNAQVPLGVMLSLIESSRAVCQVVNRYSYQERLKSGGTGFILDGGLFRESWRGKAILVTNNHVLSEYGGRIGVRRAEADAVFHYLGGTREGRSFRVQSLLWESPKEELDVTLALLEVDQEMLSAVADRLTINGDAGVLGECREGRTARVFLIGHPDGRGLEFSLSDNCLIDHDLLDADAGRSYRRIHYGAPTDKGMSGSPVLCENQLQVVGLHRAGGEILPLRTVTEQQGYKANEAVWIESIRDRAARDS